MEQKSYIPNEFRVFGEILSNEKIHIREISRKTGINPMSVQRIAEKMIKENLLDFEQNGRNKTFFIKDNLETEDFKKIYEIRKRLDVLKRNPLLRDIFEKINENKKIKLAILFGSYAKDLQHKESDIDIYIETNNKELKKEVEKINSKISVKIGAFDKKNPLIKEIIKSHIVIKGVERYQEKLR